MTPMTPVCPLSGMVAGEAVRFDPEGEPPICVVLAEDGVVYAIDDTCTHQRAFLSEGWVEGCEIDCPLHGSSFDLRTGKPGSLPATVPVRTHAVEVIDGIVHIAISGDRPNLPPGAGS